MRFGEKTHALERYQAARRDLDAEIPVYHGSKEAIDAGTVFQAVYMTYLYAKTAFEAFK